MHNTILALVFFIGTGMNISHEMLHNDITQLDYNLMENSISTSLERNERIEWQNNYSNNSGYVCRNFIINFIVSEKKYKSKASACRVADKSWKIFYGESYKDNPKFNGNVEDKDEETIIN